MIRNFKRINKNKKGETMKKIAIIIAGGVGSRMGQDIPKQFINIKGKPIIIYTLEAFEQHPSIDGIIVVCINGWQEILKSYAKQFKIKKLISIVPGGKNGQESIYHGIKEAERLFQKKDMVLIHDAIRPMVSEEIISDNIAICELNGNATAVVPCSTVVLKKTNLQYSNEVLDREKIYLTQTPQAFILKDILNAHKQAKEKGITNSLASCSLYIELGKKVYYSTGNETNIKLTRPGDLQIFEALLNTKNKERKGENEFTKQ